jgi:hypothetical protein
MALDPPLYIFGGFAEDVLFNGRIAKPHSDVDMLVYRDDIDLRMEQFRSLGFTDWEVWWQPRPGLPLVYHSTSDGLDLEPSVFERDARGSSFVIDDRAGVLHRVMLPEDTFAYPPIACDDLEFRIVSPLCLHQIREVIRTLGPFGEMRDKDIAAQSTLREQFLAHLSEDEIRPRITSL